MKIKPKIIKHAIVQFTKLRIFVWNISDKSRLYGDTLCLSEMQSLVLLQFDISERAFELMLAEPVAEFILGTA